MGVSKVGFSVMAVTEGEVLSGPPRVKTPEPPKSFTRHVDAFCGRTIASLLCYVTADTEGEVEMAPTTDYIRHAAKLTRKLYLDASLGPPAAPDAEYYKTLAKALEDIADGMDQLSKRRD
jgi:hypothetical protein